MLKSPRLHPSIRSMLLFAILGILLASLFTKPHRQRRVVDTIRGLVGDVIRTTRQGGSEIIMSGSMAGSWQRRLLVGDLRGLKQLREFRLGTHSLFNK